MSWLTSAWRTACASSRLSTFLVAASEGHAILIFGDDRMSRVQLSINVSDFDAAVAFYSRLFGAPAKLRPGYANFAVDDPPLKLVLNSPGNGPGGTINHLGVEVSSTEAVTQAEARLAAVGLATEPEPGATCCYARQDKVWAHDPDGVAWEYYTVLEHIETP
jgi:catechol 2,3-dioxygenase-like lactoylglutathione lyase family enzyme